MRFEEGSVSRVPNDTFVVRILPFSMEPPKMERQTVFSITLPLSSLLLLTTACDPMAEPTGSHGVWSADAPQTEARFGFRTLTPHFGELRRETICDDKKDNDWDSLVDGDDPDCQLGGSPGADFPSLIIPTEGDDIMPVPDFFMATGLWGAAAVDADGYTGVVYLAKGTPTDGEDVADKAFARLEGTASYGYLGYSGTGLGDNSWVIGAPGANEAYLVDGPSGDTSVKSAEATLSGDSGSRFGHDMAALGDVTGDGVDDFAVSAPYADGYAGAVYILSGDVSGSVDATRAGITLSGDAGDWVGWSVASAGDVNGDGTNDIVIGAPGTDGSGAVYFVLGGRGLSDMHLPTEADVALIGENSGDYAGYAVASGGDMNGDGYDEVVVGAPGADGYNGAVYVAYGYSSGTYAEKTLGDAQTKINGENYSLLGLSLDAGADMDDDGTPDLLLGAPYETTTDEDGSTLYYSGAVHLVVGPVYGEFAVSDASFQYRGAERYEMIGSEVTIGGDVDGDNLSDAMVGSWRGESGYMILTDLDR